MENNCTEASGRPTPDKVFIPQRLEMAENPVLKTFGQESLTEPERKELEELDWRKLGVSAGYIIFLNGRCGSTCLTHLL